MEPNSSQSSCEITNAIRNLEFCSETDNISSQCSEIAGEVRKLELDVNIPTEEDAGTSTKIETTQTESSTQETSSTESSTSDSSSSTLSSAAEPEQPAKRKRKRKRKRKKKTTTAYSPPRPFKARYKRIKLSGPAVPPKLHLRFNDDDEPDQATSDYNLKPRIIRSLERNLAINEELLAARTEKAAETLKIDSNAADKITHLIVTTLKPRIIKAIVI